jgi:hypothetical protein
MAHPQINPPITAIAAVTITALPRWLQSVSPAHKNSPYYSLYHRGRWRARFKGKCWLSCWFLTKLVLTICRIHFFASIDRIASTSSSRTIQHHLSYHPLPPSTCRPSILPTSQQNTSLRGKPKIGWWMVQDVLRMRGQMKRLSPNQLKSFRERIDVLSMDRGI